MKKVIIILLLTTSSIALANSKYICGGTDERELSKDSAVGRLLPNESAGAGCTGTLVSRTCVISAGHCYNHVKLIEFNTPLSVNGKIVHSKKEDIYYTKEIIKYHKRGIGADWLVLSVHPNEYTKLYPGDIQGFYDLDYEIPTPPLEVRITGYGGDKRDGERNFAQQTSTGVFTEIEGFATIRHKVDTRGGNSGSAIIDLASHKIIGVHTNGACFATHSNSANKGTLLSKRKKFIKAIRDCIAKEEEEL